MMSKSLTHYDERHAYAIHSGSKTTWLGDPARGEFLPREKRKAKRGKRHG